MALSIAKPLLSPTTLISVITKTLEHITFVPFLEWMLQVTAMAPNFIAGFYKVLMEHGEEREDGLRRIAIMEFAMLFCIQ